ncbi:unnamed protein product [Enterobius vermicularis]|uniref:BAG domain-containing protein n=1 Tax=Enterobius vermicularis TaxID=51028 RepID=A0A0N4V059_ENTVE|nr:unnamed protein product [Enterobius vermicularis]
MLVCKRCSPSDWRFCVATFSQNHSVGERGGYKKGGGLVDSGDLAPCRTLVGEDDDSLEKFNFKKNDKILVMGKPSASQEDGGWKKLVEYEKKNTPVIGKKYDKNEEDLAALEQNFLEGPLRMEAIKKMERRLNQFTEDCLKELEFIDGLQIVSDNTSEEQAQRNREKRKQLINGIQDLLNRNDKFVNRLQNYLYKVEHPDEGL